MVDLRTVAVQVNRGFIFQTERCPRREWHEIERLLNRAYRRCNRKEVASNEQSFEEAEETEMEDPETGEIRTDEESAELRSRRAWRQKHWKLKQTEK